MEKYYKKKLWLIKHSKNICIMLIASLMIASCTDSNNVMLDPKKPVTITLWHYYHSVQKTAFDELITYFNQTEGMRSGIIVEASSFGGVDNLAENVMMSAKGEAGTLPMPNIFSSYSDSAYELVKMDKLVFMDKYMSDDEMNEYTTSYIDEGRFADGHLVVLPIAKATEIFMLDETGWNIFENEMEQSGLVSIEMLSTWEGLLKAAELYYEWTDANTPEPHDGKALFGIDSSANYFFTGARSLGADIASVQDGKVTVNLDETVMRRLWDTFCVPMIKGHFAAHGRFRSDDVKTSDLLGFIGSTASAAYFPVQITNSKGESYDVGAYVSPVPVFEGAKRYSVIQQGAGMCVSKSTKQKELASIEFLRWFTALEQNIRFSIDSAGYFPVKNDSLFSEEMAERIHMLESSNNLSDNILASVIEHSIDQISRYDLYSSPVFSGSSQLRVIFEGIKTEFADARSALLRKTSNGGDYESEVEQLTCDAAFEQWYKNLKEKVDSVSSDLY